MKLRIPHLLTGFLLASTALTASAVPANPRPRTYTQPDGTSVTLSLRGDEHCHYFVDTDGYIIDRDSDGCFRLIGNDGRLTDIQAGKLKNLTAAQQATLVSLRPEAIHATLMQQAEASRATRMSAPATYKFKAAGEMTDPKWDNKDGHDIRNVPTDGERHVLVILVNFNDIKWTFSDNPSQDMKDMLNKPGFDKFHCTGSAFDYFTNSSAGVYKPVFDVYGPVDLPQNCSYYGGNESLTDRGSDKNPQKMVTDACRILDPTVDFSIYDTNGDGYVDNVYILYAGYGENEGAPAYTVWPHSFNLKYTEAVLPEYDGVKIDRYACSNELTYHTIGDDKLTMAGIGTFCHEFSHVLGLPDLYETSYSTGAFTPEEFSIMDHGSYNNTGRTPPVYSAYERYALEWQKPIDITSEEELNILPLVDGGLTYRITIDPSRPTEYYLLENRQLNDWDKYLPHHGLLVWHIDYDAEKWRYNIVNNTKAHQNVDLIEANNVQTSGNEAGIPFPGNNNVGEFSATSTPAFKNWNGATTKLPLSNIYETPSGLITVRVGSGSDTSTKVDTPAAALTASTSESLSVAWPKVAEAKEYAVSVTKMATDVFGSFTRSFVPGYELKRIGDVTSCVIDGLEPAQSYDVEVYAISGTNASVPATGNYFTLAKNFADVVPCLSAAPAKETAKLQWQPVADADHYTLTVGVNKPGESTVGNLVNFDGQKAPAGMLFPGATYETRESYVGTAAPSIRLSRPTGQIVSPQYTSDLASVSFWARTNRDGGQVSIKLYSVDSDPLNPLSAGTLFYIGEITDIASTADGTQVTVDNLPSGVKKLMMLYSLKTTGMQLFIDDIEYRLAGADNITPLPSCDGIRVDGTSYTVEGLQPGVKYAAYVAANKADGATKPSKTIRFEADLNSGIGSIVADSDASSAFSFNAGVLTPCGDEALTIYALDGTMIALNARGPVMLPARGLYIVKSSLGAAKLRW